MTRVKMSRRPVELFGLVDAETPGRQSEAFEQRHDIDAAGLQHRALGQVDLVQLQPSSLSATRLCRAGQEAGAHAIGLRAQPQVEARGLDLVGIERRARRQRAAVERAPLICGLEECRLPRLPWSAGTMPETPSGIDASR
jgi:hypothetical protein